MTSIDPPRDEHPPVPGGTARPARNNRRPRTESLAELTAYTVITLGIMFVVVMPMLSPRDTEEVGEVLGSLATGLGDHVDALLETTATTLVTFYLFIAGQELANRQRGVEAASHELSLRRTLSTVGLILAAVNIAACVALVAASALDTVAIGALPAIIPLTALCTLGALWLDQFSLADRDLRRGYAERDLARAESLTARLRRPDGLPPWILSILHVVLATVIAFAVFVVVMLASEGQPSAEDVALLPAMALLFLVVAAMWLAPIIALRAAVAISGNRFLRAASRLGILAACVLAIAMGVDVSRGQGSAGIAFLVAVVAMLVPIAVALAVPDARASGRTRFWSLATIARAFAWRYAARLRRKSEKTIAANTPENAPPPSAAEEDEAVLRFLTSRSGDA